MKRLFAAALVAAGLTASPGTTPVQAQTEPFIGQIQYFAGNYCPRGWAQAAGQQLPIASHTALFSIIGCTFGGDCRSTMNLPDLRGRSAVSVGTSPGLSPYQLGQRGGNYQLTLNSNNMPPHTHAGTTNATTGPANVTVPTGNRLSSGTFYNNAFPFNANLNANSVTVGTTGGQPFNMMQPYLAQLPCIALEGQYPSRG